APKWAKGGRKGTRVTIPDFRPTSSFWNDKLSFTMSGVDDERRCTWTRSPSRQGELHGGARASRASSPYLSPVRFDDRTTDRESHAHAPGLGGVEGVEQAVHTLQGQARAGILHGDEHPARGVWPGADAQLARSLADAAQRFDGVEDQVQEHLLQLDTIAVNARQALREVGLHRDAVLHHFAMGQGHDLQDGFVDPHAIRPWGLLLDEGTD